MLNGSEVDGGAGAHPFQVMAKPAGAICNLDCTYCYYTEKRALYPQERRFRMDDATLEGFIRDYVALQVRWGAREIQFSWQGGEPTLMGLDFFRRVVALQERHAPEGARVRNALQTNGILLNGEWADFFRQHNFLIGISIDGPARLHDTYRVRAGGRPTFSDVLRGLGVLRDHGVDFNTLTVVSRANLRHGRDVYRFLKNQGVRFMQFIPLVERLGNDNSLIQLPIVGDAPAGMAPWSVPPAGFGRFLGDVFDEWVKGDVGGIFVQLFDVFLGQWLGEPASLCVFAENCGHALALEHNGDLYVCDHYVYPGYRLGNIRETPLDTLARAPEQHRFGRAKSTTLPKYCQECAYRFACNGGCPKHRFAAAPTGEPGLNYLCQSYRGFLGHSEGPMKTMADLLRQGRPAAGVSALLGHNRKAFAGRK